jgi:hypothetical protein
MRIQTTRRVMLGIACALLLSLLAAAANAQQPVTETAKPAPPPQGAITGRVVSSGGEPVSGANVYLSAFGGASQGRSTMVDAGGNFKLDRLDEGAYGLFTSAPGFVPDIPISANPQPRHFYHVGDSVTLTLVKGGVITGSVTNSTNTPVINASVRAFRVRDANGQPLPGVTGPSRERLTDDRGVYRIYGLSPGSYVISAGGPGRSFSPLSGNQYESDAPTYAPSSTRDTAVEILIHSGEEITADIQYRGEPGHSISGTLAGLAQTQSMVTINATISLTDVRTRTLVMSTSTSSYNGYAYAFYGVGDGEYELYAQRFSPSPGDPSASEGRRVKVQGADLTGINLSLTPLASIAGRLVLESNPPADCVRRRPFAMQEMVISARRYVPETKGAVRPAGRAQTATPDPPLSFLNQNVDAGFEAKGDFTMRGLQAGAFRINAQLPGSGWYLRSISIGTAATMPKPSDPNIARDGLTLKSGERVAGLTVTITEGAGGLRGHISVAEGQRVPTGMRVYLVPIEREAAENVLRFFETAAEADASFAISNIAPGRYWIIARSADDGDPTKVKPIRQESALRVRILHEAEALKKEISFKPCERLADYELPYSSSATPAP